MSTARPIRPYHPPVARMLATTTPAPRPQSQLPASAAAATADNVNLASTEANTPRFKISSTLSRQAPIKVLRGIDAARLCMKLKEWMLRSAGAGILSSNPRLLRIDHLKLEHVNRCAEATVAALEDGLEMEIDIEGARAWLDITVLAVFIKHDHRIRWFYTPASVSEVIDQVTQRSTARLRSLGRADSHKNQRLFAFLAHQFIHDIAVPHHPDYLNAIATTDYAPAIELSAQEAMTYIERNEYLYDHPARNGGKDLSSDRYLFDIHEAERWLASEVDLCCAEYMLLKRLFFRDFGVECIRNREKLQPRRTVVPAGVASAAGRPRSTRGRNNPEPGITRGRGGGHRKREKIRTEAAHVRWLEEQMANLRWTSTKCRKLIVGWRLLGLLDEDKFLHWADEGGMLESAGSGDMIED